MIEPGRKLAFAVAALVLLGIAGLLALRDSGPADERDGRPERRAGPPAIRAEPSARSEPGAISEARDSPPTVPPSPSATPSPASATAVEGEARNAPAVAPREARAAAAAASTFLKGYLPYSYGRAKVRRIRAAATPLLRELAASPPRVPASVAQARPQLVSVSAEAATGGSKIDVVAVVKDGQRRYSVRLSMREAGGRWVVSAVDG